MGRKIRPMLAHIADPFDSEDFWFEVKWDGSRTLAFVSEKLRLQNRRLLNITSRYPELTLRDDVDANEAILDGEIVVLREGRPNFKLLQTREHVGDELRIELLSQTMPATFVAFDLLYLNGEPLVGLPLEQRRAKLEEVVTESPRILLSHYVETHGRRFFEEAIKLGLEGAMAKRRQSTYQIGKRSRDWLKFKGIKTMDCVIVGYTPGEGWRKGHFGALVLGAYREGKLEFMGKVGTGFDEHLLKLLTSLLSDRVTDVKPVDAEPPYEVKWVKPELVCEVKYMDLTPALKFRAPSFKRLRFDKAPEECKVLVES
ncbi:MAG: non-homologous end-joining DNA ligase [Candidatus Hodarchaeaceae archaeon]|nr:non-homologous end-joining DNA ligase [Candidatus Hodarchaeaceae archaeon]